MGDDQGDVPLIVYRLAIVLGILCATVSISAHGGGHVTRCGFSDPDEMARGAKLLANTIQVAPPRPDLPDFMDSPDGRFRVHYTLDKTSSDAIPSIEFVYAALDALDKSWKTEIDTLGYDPPPNDDGRGGSPAFDIYIKNLTTRISGYYGVTRYDVALTAKDPIKWTTWVEVDNDFDTAYRTESGGQVYKTHGMDALRATIAHELHHVIQLGSYGNNETQRMVYEFTSTWMELRVYPEIRDWAAYMNDLLSMPEGWPFATGLNSTGYVWGWLGNVLKARTGENTLRNTWNNIRSGRRPHQALIDACAQAGTPLSTIFCEESVRLYRTGTRAATDEVIPHTDSLREIRLWSDERALAPGAISTGELMPYEARVIRYNIASAADPTVPVSMAFILTWPNDEALLNSDISQRLPYTLRLTSTPSSTDIPLNGTTWGFSVDPPELCYQIDGVETRRIAQPYPQPITAEQKVLFVPVHGTLPGDKVRLTLLTTSLVALRSEVLPMQLDGNRIVAEWPVPASLRIGPYLMLIEANGTATSELVKISVR